MMERERLDVLLVARGLAESRSLAQRLIGAGEVLVDGRVVDKPGAQVPTTATLTLAARPRFVSRGGEKLDAALERFAIPVVGRIAADIGASTGGFTDCLLQRGALRVYALDVGYGQLAWALRQDSRVVVLERTNARYVTALPEPVDLIVSDVSFISVRLIYPMAVRWLREGGGDRLSHQTAVRGGPCAGGQGGRGARSRRTSAGAGRGLRGAGGAGAGPARADGLPAAGPGGQRRVPGMVADRGGGRRRSSVDRAGVARSGRTLSRRQQLQNRGTMQTGRVPA